MQTLTRDLVSFYLHLLAVEHQDPTPNFLRELVTAHLQRVPFENISKLWRKKRAGLVDIPTIDQFLSGIDQYHFGGTCYSNNYYLNLLLRALGFDVRLCGADMSHVDVHMVNMVRVHGGEYLVDVGYGAPFLEPIPLVSGANWSVQLGRWRFELAPDSAPGCWRMKQFWDGVYQHGYLAKPQAKTLEDFEPAIALSFDAESTFMRAVMLTRFQPGRAVVIRNLTITESDSEGNVERRLNNREELCEQVERIFSIPKSIVAETLLTVREPFGALD